MNTHRVMLPVLALAVQTVLLQAEQPQVPFEPVASGIMKVDTPAKQLTVELNQAEDLYLVATYGSDCYDCDQAIWAEPVLHDAQGNTVDLATFKPVQTQVGWGQLLINRDHQGRPLSIAGKTFERGFWAHAPSMLHFKLDGQYTRLTVWVGLTTGAVRGTVDFHVQATRPQMPSREEFAKPRTPATPPVPPVPAADQAPRLVHGDAARRLLDHGIEQLVFVRRYTLSADHVYTEHVNSRWMPGGGLCVLDLTTGDVRELVPELTNTGVVNRFDVSFDAQRIVFDFKRSAREGYRLYEVNVDGTGLRQLTFPNEGALRETDDMQPCYLPDGGIAFVTTRCQYGVLCAAGDQFTVTNMYRIEADGSGMRALSSSPLNEQSPVMLPDGRILYHRWEYLDKPAGNIKSLWAMNPDGSGSVEVYGNSIAFPETMIYGRPIPGARGKIVLLGTSHCCPNNAMGTVIQVDLRDEIRSPDAMQFITSDVHALAHNGFHFLGEDGQWVYERTGAMGRLFKDPFPISEDLFIVSYKPPGLEWNAPAGYQLHLLDGDGKTQPLYQDESVSLWHAYPLVLRPVPPVMQMTPVAPLAAEGLATCMVTDVYRGMEGVQRGTIKYLRVLEQLPRPWAARKAWNDRRGHAHSVIGDGTLGVKVQHGIVPVEEDGSAHFVVPAMRAIYFQALDENHMAVQTERTYVNYMPGEVRSCVGCHETTNVSVPPGDRIPLAALRRPSVPGPQPGEPRGGRVFDYHRHIQPIWDRHCIECHNDQQAEGGLNLVGTSDELFSTSYHQLLARSGAPKQLLGFRSARNEDAASLSQDACGYLPPYTFGSPTSTLAGLLSNGRITMRDEPLQRYVDSLRESHQDIRLTQEELIQVVNWLDVNAPFHPSYWGRFHAEHQGHPNYRPQVTLEQAQMREIPEPIRRAEAAGAGEPEVAAARVP